MVKKNKKGIDYDKSFLVGLFILINSIYFVAILIAIQLFILLQFEGKIIIGLLLIFLLAVILYKIERFSKLLKNENN